MNNYEVTVCLSEDLRQTSGGYRPEASYRRACITVIEAADANRAMNTAWEIFNSYPEEMFCDERYRNAVTAYRKDGNRSLSVGDVLRLTTRETVEVYAVAYFGYRRIFFLDTAAAVV